MRRKYTKLAEYAKPSLQNQTYLTKPAKPNLLNQTYQTCQAKPMKPAKRNLTHVSAFMILYQPNWFTKIVFS